MPEVDILRSLRNLSFDLPVEVDLETQINSVIGGPVVAQLLGYLNIDKECQISIIAILAGRGPSFTFDPILRACNKGMHGLFLSKVFFNFIGFLEKCWQNFVNPWICKRKFNSWKENTWVWIKILFYYDALCAIHFVWVKQKLSFHFSGRTWLDTYEQSYFSTVHD